MKYGKTTLPELVGLIEALDVDTVVVAFPDLYGRLVGKRFAAPFFRDAVARSGTHACDYLLTVDMEMEPVSGYEFSNWESGYGDLHMVPDMDTLRVVNWLPATALVLSDVYTTDHRPIPMAPRTLLRDQIARAGQAGFTVKAGSEAEYYLFNQSYRSAGKNAFRRLRPASEYIEDYHILQSTREEPFNRALRNHLEASDIPVECTKGEWGAGQHELNLRFCDVLEMADRHTLYKQCAKEVADEQGKAVTFMAKPSADAAGSSCHVHVSLWQDGINAFAGDQSLGQIQCSRLFRWFLGGWLRFAAELMVFMAPNVNSYKRFQAGSWAPTRLAWATDNRTAGFRIVGSGESLRIECRIPGADCNAYLTYAAALAAGLTGIEQQIEPPDPFEGNAYQAQAVEQVPGSLHAAIDRFAHSEFAQRTFGEQVHRHYVHFFRTEQAAYDRAVTDWELQRYFERI